MTLSLYGAGLFTWPEWTAALSEQLHSPAAATDGSDYYDHWLNALAGLLARKGIADTSEIELLTAAWQRAAHATPHGKAIQLESDPQSYAGGVNVLKSE